MYGPELPILPMTAGGNLKEQARAMGAFDELPKPFDLDHLLAAVRDGLGRAPRHTVPVGRPPDSVLRRRLPT